MPVMESITIINKSGKVVSTGKHLVNIFKDARDAYNDKKAELRVESQKRAEYRTQQKLLNAREETRSVASSRHSHRSHRSHRSSATREGEKDRSRPPLTTRNLDYISEVGSETTSRHGRSRHGSRHGGSRRGSSVRSSSHQGERIRSPSRTGDAEFTYRQPYMETALTLETRPEGLVRRHTERMAENQVMTRRPERSMSNPNIRDSQNIDMNLAYGPLPHPSSLNVSLSQRTSMALQAEPEQELQENVSKLDALLLEAQCLQHSAIAIITNLQANPEAMAAVALTLAEISNLIAKCSPGILTAIKSSSPAIFALLASPQFMIAGGVALGVTIVMFGGFKIIKKIQGEAEEKKEEGRMDEAMVFEAQAYVPEYTHDYVEEMSSIESWRRGIADVESQSIATSVSGEFITPEADRQRKERIRERAREERRERYTVAESVASESVRSESTVRTKEIPKRTSSKSVVSEAVTAKTSKTSRTSKEPSKDTDAKKKKNNMLMILLKKNKESKEKSSKSRKSESVMSHRPRMIEV